MRIFNTQLFRVLEGGKSCKNTEYLSVVSISISTQKLGLYQTCKSLLSLKNLCFSP